MGEGQKVVTPLVANVLTRSPCLPPASAAFFRFALDPVIAWLMLAGCSWTVIALTAAPVYLKNSRYRGVIAEPLGSKAFSPSLATRLIAVNGEEQVNPCTLLM